MADSSYDPEPFEESSSEEMESEQEDLHEEGMFLVIQINIDDLFSGCSMCGNAIIHTEASPHFGRLEKS